MKCTDCQSLFSDLHDGALSDRGHQGVLNHLGSCHSCSEGYLGFRQALVAFRTVGKEPIPDGFLEELDRRVALLPGGPSSPPREPGVPWRRVMARATLLGAATVLVVLAFYLGESRGNSENRSHESEQDVVSRDVGDQGEVPRAEETYARERLRLELEIATLQARCAAMETMSQELRAEVEILREKEPLALTPPVMTPPVMTPPVMTPPVMTSDRSGGESRGLAIDLSGPDSSVIPRLIALCASEDQELGNLAFHLLEGRVARLLPGGRDRSSPASPALLAALGSWVGEVRKDLGWRGQNGGGPVSTGESRQREVERIKELLEEHLPWTQFASETTRL